MSSNFSFFEINSGKKTKSNSVCLLTIHDMVIIKSWKFSLFGTKYNREIQILVFIFLESLISNFSLSK